MQLEQRPRAQPREAYERADWSKIGKEVQMKLGYVKQIVSQQQLDATVDDLSHHQHLPRPSGL